MKKNTVTKIQEANRLGTLHELDALIKEFLDTKEETLLTISYIQKLAIDRGLTQLKGGSGRTQVEFEKIEIMKDNHIVPLFIEFKDAYILRFRADTDGSVTAHFQRAISDRLEHDPWSDENHSTYGSVKGLHPATD